MVFIKTLFRSPAWSNNPNLRGWRDLNDVGAHLGQSLGYDLRVYKKDMDRGLQKLDDTAGLYLFESEPLHLGISNNFIPFWFHSLIILYP